MSWVLFVVVLVITVFAMSSSEPHIDPQPFISDEDFCRLVPEVPEDVALKVRQVLVDATGWDRDEIHPKTKLAEFEM